MKWSEFKNAAPELADSAQKLFEGPGIVLVGTIRRDGSPRISPVETMFFEGDLVLGMMWRSYKAQDLLRDPRCTIHNAITDRMATDGEFKLHGRAREIQDLQRRGRYREALLARIGWAPEEPHFHLFSVELHSAGLFTADGDARLIRRWRVGEEVHESRQTLDDVNPSKD